MCLLLFGLSMGYGTLHAQAKSYDTTARYFIIQASIGNLQEAAQGQIAMLQAVSPEVRSFAQRIVTDHNMAQDQLTQLIKARGFQIPPEATDIPAPNMMLKNTPAKDFDRIYVHMMVGGHRQTVQLFETYALTGKDPDVKAWAEQTLPVLKEHLAAILALEERRKDAVAQ